MATLSQVSKSSPANMRSTIPAGACLWTGALVTVVVIGLLAMGSAQAIDIPALPMVPPNIAATNPALVQQRVTLISERKALLDKTNKHNSMCNAVEAGSAADSICTRAYAPLEVEIKSHVQVSKQYNTSLLAAVNLVASQKPAPPPPHTDTSVVDARVPSGLPKSVDDAIPHSPSGDRVRKGFQAIQDGDWKVALAWFQDARNKEPGNPGLGRLVDLAEFTLEYRKSAPMAAEKNTGAAQAAPVSSQHSTANSTVAAAAKLKDSVVQAGDNSIARAAANQMAARARADAAFKQYVAKHGGGDRYSPDRNKAVQRAVRGEGYSDEELKAQLAKALQEYRENYRKLYPNGPPAGVGGNPAAEEITLGGKG